MSHSSPIPHLVVSDGEAAIAFYEKAFGATCEAKHMTEDGKRVMYGHLKVGAGAIYLNDDFPEFGDQSAKAPTRLGGTSCVIHLDVPDADAAWERAIRAGAQIVMPLDDQFWDARYGQLKDPFGHLWSVGGR
jgi:PhnB protein